MNHSSDSQIYGIPESCGGHVKTPPSEFLIHRSGLGSETAFLIVPR